MGCALPGMLHAMHPTYQKASAAQICLCAQLSVRNMLPGAQLQ